MKNVSTSTVGRKVSEAVLYDRIAVKKPLLRKQNNVKRLQLAKVHKNWKIEQCNKVLWTKKSKFKIFRSVRWVYVCPIGLVGRVFINGPGDHGRTIPKTQKMVLDATLLNTQHYKVCIKYKIEQSRDRSCTFYSMWQRVGETQTINHGQGFFIAWEAFAICKVGEFTPSEGQIESDWLSLYSVIQSHLEHGLLVKDFYSCKIMTKSTRVNSGRSTLKSKKNSMSFNQCLGRHNQQT